MSKPKVDIKDIEPGDWVKVNDAPAAVIAEVIDVTHNLVTVNKQDRLGFYLAVRPELIEYVVRKPKTGLSQRTH